MKMAMTWQEGTNDQFMKLFGYITGDNDRGKFYMYLYGGQSSAMDHT